MYNMFHKNIKTCTFFHELCRPNTVQEVLAQFIQKDIKQIDTAWSDSIESKNSAIFGYIAGLVYSDETCSDGFKRLIGPGLKDLVAQLPRGSLEKGSDQMFKCCCRGGKKQIFYILVNNNVIK